MSEYLMMPATQKHGRLSIPRGRPGIWTLYIPCGPVAPRYAWLQRLVCGQTSYNVAAVCRHQSPCLHCSAYCRLLVAELFRSPARRHGMTSRKSDISRIIDHISSRQDTCSGSIFLTTGTYWTLTDRLRGYFLCVRLFSCIISACMLYYCNMVR